MTIEPGLYWQLRALTSEAERAAEKFRAIDAQRLAVFKAIADRHGLSQAQAYRLIDETCEMVPMPAGPTPKEIAEKL